MLLDLQEIGKRIKNAREELGMKQYALASKAGIDTASLCRYENGKQEPNLETFIKIAQALNVSTDHLLFGEKREPLFSKKEEKEATWSEIVCYAIATLIEENIVEITDDEQEYGVGMKITGNSSVVEFMNKFLMLRGLKGSFSTEQYKTAKLNLIKEYEHSIFLKRINLMYDDKYIKMEEENEFFVASEELIENYKKMLR